jgi:hypothetical protein
VDFEQHRCQSADHGSSYRRLMDQQIDVSILNFQVAQISV